MESVDLRSNMKAYITVGLPASGKSTWAREFAKTHPVVIVNNDTIRNEIYARLGHRNWSKEIEAEVKRIREEMILDAAKQGMDVIVDNTHMNPWSRNQIEHFCKQNGFETEIVDFTEVPIDECIRRDSLRTGHEKVGEEVIRKMWKTYTTKKAIRYLPDYQVNGLPLCLIVDLDGTLAWNNTGRNFYGNDVHLDAVRLFVRDTIEALGNLDKIEKIFIFSGREGNPELVANTISWLNEKCNFSEKVKNKLSLHFRPEKNVEPDAKVKTELYNAVVKDQYSVFAVFDDRAQVIRNCWKPLNLPVFRCGVIDEDEF